MSRDQIDWSDPASFARVRDQLRQKLRGRYSRVDEHLLEASIEDALMHYKRCPQGFDASRGCSLYYYLELRARSYLNMRLRKVNRRRQHERAVGVWDNFFEKILSDMRRRWCINKGKDEAEQEAEERAERRKEVLNGLLALLNPHDRAGVELLRAGAAREEWIQHLGIESLPQKEQQRKVNVEKDRLKKKLKRWAQEMQGG